MNDYGSFFSSSAFLNLGLSSSQKTLIFSALLPDYRGPPLIPHYEEARRHFDNPDVIHDFEEANEIAPYMTVQLESISTKYGGET